MNVGVIFIPDVVWLPKEKYQRLLDDKGHLRPGVENARRDR